MFAAEREWVRATANAFRTVSVDDGVYING